MDSRTAPPGPQARLSLPQARPSGPRDTRHRPVIPNVDERRGRSNSIGAMSRLVAFVAGSVLLLSGCGGTAQDSGETAAEPPPAAAPTSGQDAPGGQSGGAATVPAQLEFSGTTLNGKAFDGASLAGKPAVVWFWAPWCTTCRADGPSVAKIAKKYGDKVSVIGIAGLDKSKDLMDRFVSQTGTGDVTHLDDRDGKLYRHFKVTTQSFYVFLSKDGKPTKAPGPLGESRLASNIDKLLG
jgi:thiol-disulfide isomerase/thioredoxin